MAMDNETGRLYEPLLHRGGKIIERKNVSLSDSGRYMRWIAETLADSFDRKRRPPYQLLMELIPVLMEAAEKAELADELHRLRENNVDSTRAFEKAKDEALNSLLSGFGLITQKGGATGSAEKQERQRSPASCFFLGSHKVYGRTQERQRIRAFYSGSSKASRRSLRDWRIDGPPLLDSIRRTSFAKRRVRTTLL